MFTFQRRKSAQRKHAPASAKRSRSKPAAPSRLFLEPLEDRTLLNADFSQLPAAFDTLLPAMQNATNHDVYMSTTIPLLGNQLQMLPSGTQFLTDMQKVLDADIKAPQNAQDVVADFTTNPNNVFSDLKLDLTKSSVAPPDTSNPNNVTFTVTMVSQPVSIQGLTLDFGLKNLGLNLGPVTIPATLKYTVNLDFGVTDTDVYLSTTRNPVIQFSLSLPLTIPNSGLSFGPLSITVGQPSTPSVTFDVAFTAPNSGSQIFVKQDLQQKSYDLTANSALSLGGADLSFSLPFSLAVSNFSLSTTLALDWPISVNQQTHQVSVSSPTLSLNDITLDVSSFISGVFQPLADDINAFLKPLSPFADALSKPVPVLSQISGLLGALSQKVPIQKLTMATLFDYVYDIEQNTTGQPAEDFLNLYDALKAIATLFGPQSAKIDFGSYTFGSYDGSSLSTLTPSGLPDLSQVASQIKNTIGGVISSINDSLNSVFGNINQAINLHLMISAPIFDDPINNALKMLLGETVGLFQIEFDCNLGYNDALPFIPILGPLGVQIDAGLNLYAKLVMGYDTYGLDTGNLADGFYVDPTTDLNLTASVTADAAADVVIAEVGGGGGIQGTLDFPINTDPNIVGALGGGKVRLSNINMALSHGPLCIFDPNGSITVSLNVFVKVGIDPFSVTWSKDLGSDTIASFNLGCSMAPKTQPVLAGRGDWTFDPMNNVFNPNPNNGAGGVLYLDMGPYASDRGLKVWNSQGWGGDSTDGDENFLVTYVSTQPDGSETVDISSSGYVERYTGVTQIRAEGGLGNNTVKIDPKVMVPVALFGSVDTSDPNYVHMVFPQKYLNFMSDPDFAKSHNVLQAGGGPALLVGGQGTDQLIGGSGLNFIRGGKAQANSPNTEILVGGTGPNLMKAGDGGTNTLSAGPLDGDLLIGGNLPSNKDIFIAGAGADVMDGGAGANTYEWQEGNGHLTIHGGIGPSASNSLEAVAVTAGGSLVVKPGMSSPLEVDITVPSGNANMPNETTIYADTIQTVSVDDLGDATNYTIEDLAGTGVKNVSANLHEVGGGTGALDKIVINGSGTVVNTVVVSANPNVLAGNRYDAQGNKQPAVYGQATNVDLTIAGDDFAGRPGAEYLVTAAIPKSSDTLTINTGIANDTVSVESTQGANSDNTDLGNGPPNLGGSVFVNTIAGNNTINVGTATPAFGVGLLDRIQGNLYIDAGTGAQNKLNVDESNATNGDTLVLTADPTLQNINNVLTLVDEYQILRYTGEDLSSNPDGGVPGFPGVPVPSQEPQRYPMLIQYSVETGGAFGGGIKLYQTRAPDVLYVTDTMPGAPTTIYSDGTPNANLKDKIIVGYNPLDTYGILNNSPQNSFLTNLLGPLDVEGADWQKSGQGDVDLQVFDEAAGSAQYEVSANAVQRAGLLPITYNVLGEPGFAGFLTLNATNASNSIFVTGTAKDTTTTVNTGTATSSILVGEPIRINNIILGYVLDAIQGALTINGGAGTDNLVIKDDFNTLAYTYQLTATTLQRFFNVAIASISFNQMTTMDLYEASLGDNTTYVSGTAAGTTSTIYPGSGTDNLNVSTLDQFKGPLDFVWSSGIKGLGVDDSSAAGADTYTVNPLELDRTGAAKIQFDPLASVLLAVGKTQDEMVNIPTINAGTQVEVFGGKGLDTITVANSGKDLTAILGTLIIQGGADTSLDIEDQNATSGRTYTLGGVEFQAASPATSPPPPPFCTIQYFQLTDLVLDSGSKGNLTTVSGTAAGNSVTVHAGTGDQITVTDANHTLQGIRGPLFVVGVGKNDKLTLDDTNGSPGSIYLLKPIEVDHPSNAAITYQLLANLTLEGSAGGDSYQVQGTFPGTQYQIIGSGFGNTLTGPNAASIWNITAANQGTLGKITFSDVQNLVGGTKNDDFKFVGAAANITGNINGGGGTADKLDYSGNGGGAIAVTLTGPSSGTATSIGGTFSNIESLVGSSSMGDVLTGANVFNNWDITGANAGKVNTFSYTGIENLVGGTNVDIFKFSAAGTEHSVDGGGAPANQGNWLDYSGVATAVTVDLATGTAQIGAGPTVAISKIQDVHGGSGPNTLTGDSQGNILIGGSGAVNLTGGLGRSLLIADKGAGNITGGSGASASGGDILIGGTTIWDSDTNAHLVSLMSILAEWQSGSLYATRVSHLRLGGGLNGSNKLIFGTTVKDNGVADALAAATTGPGTPAVDWFFMGALDTAVNVETGEGHNNGTF